MRIDDNAEALAMMNRALGSLEKKFREAYNKGYHDGVKSMLSERPTNRESPNNCKYLKESSGDVWECGCFLEIYCEHQIYDRYPDGTLNMVRCNYEPQTKTHDKHTETHSCVKDEPQTKLCRECDDYAGNGMYCAENHIVYDFSISDGSCNQQTGREGE